MSIEGLILTGIGGQGTILWAKLLTNALDAEGFEVSELETLGAIQRGGPVLVEIQYGRGRVGGPVPFASANMVFAQEVYEGMRQSAKFLRDGGVLLQNEKLVPVVGHYRSKKGFIRGDDYQELIPPCVGTLYSTNASQLALAAGNPRAENMALWGLAVGLGLLPTSPDICRSMIDRFMSGVSAQFSRDAFTAGLNYAQTGAVVPTHPRQMGSENGGALASEPAGAGRATGEETRGG